MRKEHSTNSVNQKKLHETCGMAFTLSKIGGRWKLSILGILLNNPKLRYSELRRRLSGISERIFAAQLKELEQDGLITKTIFPEVPPKVEYQLTDLGYSLRDILEAMSVWGDEKRGEPAVVNLQETDSHQ
ncbi:DNA-binding transcriptional regulator, HxlR family [Pseudarcicella hirudinis]|uniref:DNA-binding transcriptional regulator, HxlR family n=1 Tax=Pseudarcicella hirudinis TaxID=1079859 RepID=A0A1I5RZZ1_9BACT|nr:helix-turn-helix domain-containing protein [Pseudarcicella hirudinis]SFP64079.1 DNA-binding transcriptional regulator, HxlR family [Pseudarcicella hirudinis]